MKVPETFLTNSFLRCWFQIAACCWAWKDVDKTLKQRNTKIILFLFDKYEIFVSMEEEEIT